MNHSVVLPIILLFVATLVAGFLTPNEVREVEEFLMEVLEEEIVEEEEVTLPISTTNETNIPILSNPSTLLSSADTELLSVVRVIDGDTIVVNKEGINESVRLIGIDTPETVHPSKPVQCFGEEASRKTKEWLEGSQVILEIDEGEGERDKYRRLLAYVYRDDGLFVNLELIKQGYAYEYTYATPYQYQAEFKAAQAEAQTAGNGLWGEDACS